MGHHHTHEQQQTSMPFHEKAEKLLDHWMKHNDDHAEEYRRWADLFRQHAMDDAASALESAARQNQEINAALARAREQIHPH